MREAQTIAKWISSAKAQIDDVGAAVVQHAHRHDGRRVGDPGAAETVGDGRGPDLSVSLLASGALQFYRYGFKIPISQ